MYKLLDRMEHVFYNMIFSDIQKVNGANAIMGTFILLACLIDYLAGFRYCKNKGSSEKAYTDFVNNYLKGKYNGKDLYKSLRCKLVHNYSEGGKYIFTNNNPTRHLKKQNTKIIINLENFINDIKDAMDKYFIELKKSNELQNDARTRIDTLSILYEYQFEPENDSHNNYDNSLFNGNESTK